MSECAWYPRRAVEPLELQLWMAESHHVGARNWIPVLCNNIYS